MRGQEMRDSEYVETMNGVFAGIRVDFKALYVLSLLVAECVAL